MLFRSNAVFISTKPGFNPNNLDMEEFRTIQNEVNSKREIEGYEFISLTDLYVRAVDMRRSVAMRDRKSVV